MTRLGQGGSRGLLRAGAGEAGEPADLETLIEAPQAWRRRAGVGGSDAVPGWRLRGFAWAASADRPVRRVTPVVLLHGLIVAARMCIPTARRLAPDGPVLVPDLPGCGRSSKPEPVPTIAELGAVVATWLDDLDVPPVVLVGTSVGTQVALHAARQSPERVAGLVLASPTVDRYRRRWFRQLWRWQVEQSTQSVRLRAIQVSDYAAAGVSRAVRTFASALADRPEELVPALDMPLLACLGTRDPLLSRRWVEELAKAAPRGRMIVLPGVVHAMCHDNPVELTRVVNGFIDHLPRQRAPGRPPVRLADR